MEYAPIALFCYKRISVLKKTIEALQKNKECTNSLLFIFSDGYKNEEEKEDVINVRNYIKTITGFRQIQIFESNYNKGLANSIIDGVTKIINEYGRIIVIEDDIITSPYFLKYMNTALKMYENDETVGSISGFNHKIKGLPQTYFSSRFECWGWATWKRSWDFFEQDGKKLLNKIIQDNKEFEYNYYGTQNHIYLLENHINGKNDTWASRMYASMFLNNKLQLLPGVSLTKNIGFGNAATHCKNIDKRFDVNINQNDFNIKKIKIKVDKKVLKKCIKYFERNSSKYKQKPSFLNIIKKFMLNK